jgi:putative oxidoreductase
MDFKLIFLWICTALFVFPSLFFGFQKVKQNPEIAQNFTRWGYSKLFMIALGVVEIATALALLFPTTRLYAIYVYAIILVGAIFTHLKAQDKMKEVMAPVFVSVLLIVIYFLQIK